MRGILLVSHGLYAQEFKGSLQMIAGATDHVYTACLESQDGPESFTAKLEALKPELDRYEEVLVFSDLFGGSPGNAAFQYFIQDPRVQFIAGMNFPMVLNAILSEGAEVANLVAEGREAIVDVRAFMSASMDDIDE